MAAKVSEPNLPQLVDEWWPDWHSPARAYGPPLSTAVIRASADDFRVDELPLVEPDGEGEHLLLRVEKRDSNSEWVARQLARAASIAPSAVGMAGLKDRHAVTRQWYSLHLPGAAPPDLEGVGGESFRVIEQAWHRRKLRRGALRGNRFELLLREIAAPPDRVDERLQSIAANGVPNYFGPQRFGREGGNLAAAQRLFAGAGRVDRHRRSLYLSAARSLLFNATLDRRVSSDSWNRLLDGEVVMLDGSRSHFVAGEIDDELERRLAERDIHPSAPLWGRGSLESVANAQRLEQEVMTPFADWCDGLERAGLRMERRPLRLMPSDLQWSWPEQTVLRIGFSLPAGGYATSLVAELFDPIEPQADWVDDGDG